MALTVTLKFGPYSAGPTRQSVYELTFDSSYPTGGEAFTPAAVGLSEFIYVGLDPVDSTSGALIFNFDYTNNKILAFFPTGGAASAPTSLQAPSVALPSGSTTVTSSAAAPDLTETPGQAAQVGSTANLASVKVRAYVVGF